MAVKRRNPNNPNITHRIQLKSKKIPYMGGKIRQNKTRQSDMDRTKRILNTKILKKGWKRNSWNKQKIIRQNQLKIFSTITKIQRKICIKIPFIIISFIFLSEIKFSFLFKFKRKILSSHVNRWTTFAIIHRKWD